MVNSPIVRTARATYALRPSGGKIVAGLHDAIKHAKHWKPRPAAATPAACFLIKLTDGAQTIARVGEPQEIILGDGTYVIAKVLP